MAITERDEIKVGDKVDTIDGPGKITDIGDRYFKVKLDNGAEALLTSRDVSLR